MTLDWTNFFSVFPALPTSSSTAQALLQCTCQQGRTGLGDDGSLSASDGGWPKTSSLDLQVREFGDLALGQSLGGGSGEAERKRCGDSDLSPALARSVFKDI
jgi:hypothetical protein